MVCILEVALGGRGSVMSCSLPEWLVAFFGSLIKTRLRGVKQFPVQSEIGSVACSADVGGQQGVSNGLQKALEGMLVRKLFPS